MRDRQVALLLAAASALFGCAEGAQLEGVGPAEEEREEAGSEAEAGGTGAGEPGGWEEAPGTGDNGGVEAWPGPGGAGEALDESCATPGDDDQDGEANEGCACTPGATRACYGGPLGTEGVGPCRAGVQTCAADGLSWEACAGAVLPAPVEDMNTPEDDDCSGTIHDSDCELNGIVVCPSSLCLQVPTCLMAGGVVDCSFAWRCVP